MSIQSFSMSCEGMLDYEPRSADGKGGNAWWLILRCDEEIIQYYQWWIQREHKLLLQRPLFGAHVSVMRGEIPSQNHNSWKQRQGETLTLQYHHEIQTADGFWWLPASCPELEQLRASFGLPKLPEHGFHMTIGRVMP